MDLLDTFPAFERFWQRASELSIPDQVEAWRSEYMAPWPELLRVQVQNYRRAGLRWRSVAERHVFPKIPHHLGRIRRLHANLRRELPLGWRRAQRGLRIDFPVRFVIYVGVGCGVGWATRLGGSPAVLLGLENAAELSDGRRGEWPGSVVHEVAHLAHEEWRRRSGLPPLGRGRGPFWQLYEEGLATECERRIEPAARFRLRTGRPDWLPWCEAHRADLARMFWRATRARRSVRPFFGSWYRIHGQTECGYYLGAEAIRELARTRSMEEIARLSSTEVGHEMKRALTGMRVLRRPRSAMSAGP